MDTKTTLGVVIGNRGFFPAHLCDTGRKEILAVLEAAGFETEIISTGDAAIERLAVNRNLPKPGGVRNTVFSGVLCSAYSATPNV